MKRQEISLFNSDCFEEIVDNDALDIIIKFIPQRFRIPLLFVNRRWRRIGQKKRRAIANWRGMNFQRVEILDMHAKTRWFSHLAASNLDLLKWCIGMGCPVDDQFSYELGLHGNLDAVKWALEEKVISSDMERGLGEDPIGWVRSAIKKGHMDIIRLAENRIWDHRLISDAICSGNLEVYQFLKQRYPLEYGEEQENALSLAISCESFEIAKDILAEMRREPEDLTQLFLMSYKISQWMKSNIGEWDRLIRVFIDDCASVDVSLDLVRSLHTEVHIHTWTGITHEAIRWGDLEVVKYMNNSGILGFFNLEILLKSRKIEILKLLLGRVDNRQTRIGRIERLIGKWGSIEVLNTIFDEERNMGEDLNQTNILYSASLYGNFKLVDYAINKKGFNWDTPLEAVEKPRFNHLDRLIGAVNRGFKINENSMSSLSSTTNWKILDYATKKCGSSWNPELTLQIALRNGTTISVLNWITSNSTRKQRGNFITKKTIEFV